MMQADLYLLKEKPFGKCRPDSSLHSDAPEPFKHSMAYAVLDQTLQHAA